VLVLSAIPFALIYKQPDLGTALVLAAVLVAVLLIGGASGRHLALLAVIAVGLSVGVVHFHVLKSYQQDRLGAFVSSPDQPNAALLRSVAGANEYNLAESKVAIGDGGVTGKGIGKGTQTNLGYVPEQRTDFIFTAVGEQLGLIGSGLLLLLFAIVIWRTWRAATLARDLVGTLICVGVLAMLIFQVFTILCDPIGNTISRYVEHRADVYGQEVVHGIVADPQATGVHSFQTLGEESLDIPDPNRWMVLWTYSHPPIAERAEFARGYDPWKPGVQPRFFKR